MTVLDPQTATVAFPAQLPLLRARLTLRLLETTTLPPYKGAMLRGGFGYAFQRACCPQACWGRAEHCAVSNLCPFRWVFATPHPPDLPHLHDLHDVPRPFVIEPPLDHKRQYNAGDALEFGLVLIGRGIDFLPYFLFAFERLGAMGLGRDQAKARLERVEALRPWLPTGPVLYQDGQVMTGDRRPETGATTATPASLPLYDGATLAAQAVRLPADLRLTLHTPLRVKARGVFIENVDLPAIVQSICWRLNALAAFHGGGPWDYDYRPLVEQARAVVVEDAQVKWVDWERTSTRSGDFQKMKLGGIIGSAVLRGVAPDLRTVLLAGSVAHAGKATVWGHGGMEVKG